MLWCLIHRYLGVGEIESAAGRALVEERYLALRPQIPIIYMIAIVNLCGVELATGGRLTFGLNVPTALVICAIVRILQWLLSPKTLTHEMMVRRLKQTCWLAAAICLTVSIWSLQLRSMSTSNAMAVMLFGSMTAIGVSYGLSPLPTAARIPLVVLALPLATMGFMSQGSLGAALSLCVVCILMLRMLNIVNKHFTGVIESRSVIAQQQQVAESARKEAIVAATTDFLTGLPNRRAFVAALDGQMEKSKGHSFAVGILDLDRFKVTNDTFGHATGDKLLATVAARLLAAAGSKAVVARLGGDEFGLLLPNVSRSSDARRTASRILAAVNRPAVVDGRQFAISVCCGIAIARAGRERTPSRLLADADVALYEAKDLSNGGSVAVFEAWMEAPRRRRAQIERALQLTHVHERVELVFQPIIDLQSGRVVANEALARWTDDELGEVSPSEFVPIAEQLNVIGNLSNHLMVKAFDEAAKWPDTVRLSFNLSAIQLCAPDSAELILDALRQAKLDTKRLQVEVTETALLGDFDRANDNLAQLRKAGVTIVLDDFGAGFASIGYLKELRFDQIKLDGGLLTSALDSADGERLLSAVIGLCHALGVGTVAEHVESEQQLKLLLKLGCEAGQGFWLQTPMSAADCREFSHSSAMILGSGRHSPRRSAA